MRIISSLTGNWCPRFGVCVLSLLLYSIALAMTQIPCQLYSISMFETCKAVLPAFLSVCPLLVKERNYFYNFFSILRLAELLTLISGLNFSEGKLCNYLSRIQLKQFKRLSLSWKCRIFSSISETCSANKNTNCDIITYWHDIVTFEIRFIINFPLCSYLYSQ